MKKFLNIILVLLFLVSFVGAQEIRRPTTYSGDTGFAGNYSYAYDSNDSGTYAWVDGDSNGNSKYITFSGWQAASGAYSRLTLTIVNDCIPNTNVSCSFSVSLDAGATWANFTNPITIGSGTGAVTWTTDIPPNTVLSNIRVMAGADSYYDPGNPGTPPDYFDYVPPSSYNAENHIFGIYTSGWLGATPSTTTIRGTTSITWPTNWTTLCPGGTGAYQSTANLIPNAYDADVNTNSYEYAASTGGSTYKGKYWCAVASVKTFSKPTNMYSMALKVKPQCSTTGGSGYSGCYVYYSLNNGTSWYYAWGSTGTVGAAEYTVILPTNQDISTLLVADVAFAGTTYSSPYTAGTSYAYIYDARIEAYAQNTAPENYIDVPAANGSGSVTRYQSVTFAGWSRDAESGGSTTVTYSLDGGAWTGVTRRTYRSDVTTSYNAGYEWDWSVGATSTGTHTWKTQSCDGGGLCTVAGPYNFTVNAEPVPAAPTNPVITPAANGLSIALSWTNPGSSYYFAYNYMRECAGAACSPTDVLQGSIFTSATRTTTACTHYRYQFGAVNHDYAGNWTGIYDVDTPCKPADVTNVTASASADGRTATVSWTNNGSGNGYYARVHRSVNGGADVWEDLTGVSSKGYTVSPGNTVAFSVEAGNNVGPTFNWVAATPSTLTMPTYPAAATGLTFPAIYSGSVSLSWTDNANNETAYRVFQCTGTTAACASGPWTQRGGDFAAGTTNINPGSLSAATTYTYKVTAVNAVGTVDSALAQVTTLAIPPTPNFTTLTPGSNGTTMSLGWTVADGTQTRVSIARCTGAACTPQAYVSVGRIATSYPDTGLTPGTLYRYYVYTANDNDSPVTYGTSATLEATTPDYPGTPSITVTATGSKSVSITWADVANETGYTLERCTGSGCGSFATINSPGAGSTGYNDSGLTPGTSYTYRLTANNAVGSRQSNTAAVGTWGRMRPQTRDLSHQ